MSATLRPLRAIRSSEWGGPEVLELVGTAPCRSPATARSSSGSRARAELRRHPPATEHLPRGARLPLVARGRGGGRRRGGRRRRRRARRRPRRQRRLRGVRAAPAALTFPIPDGVDDGTALAILLQGLTAWHLYRTSRGADRGRDGGRARRRRRRRVARGAARQAIGAGRVIATASSEEKRALALELGADAAVDASPRGHEGALIEANLGERVDAVLEMAGGEVFDQCFQALAPFGRLVAYGIAAASQRGPTACSCAGPARSSGSGSCTASQRPAEMVDEALKDLFGRAARGELRVVGRGLPPRGGGRAHDRPAGAQDDGQGPARSDRLSPAPSQLG